MWLGTAAPDVIENHDLVWAALIAAVPASIAAIGGVSAAVQGRRRGRKGKVLDEINEAINQRHEDEPKLYDYVRSTATEISDLRREHAELGEDLRAHVEWDFAQHREMLDQVSANQQLLERYVREGV